MMPLPRRVDARAALLALLSGTRRLHRQPTRQQPRAAKARGSKGAEIATSRAGQPPLTLWRTLAIVIRGH